MTALSFLFPTLIIATFYFFLIRPHNKREEATKKFQDSLQPGMTVVTTGGICGRIEAINPDQIITLRIDKEVRIIIFKYGIKEEFYDSASHLQNLGPYYAM